MIRVAAVSYRLKPSAVVGLSKKNRKFDLPLDSS